MIIWRIVLFLFYLDGEIFHLIYEGRPLLWILAVALTISTAQIFAIYFPIWSLIRSLARKTFYFIADEKTIEFGEKIWEWLKQWRGSSVAERWARRWNKIVRYKYFILFLLNLVPLPQFTTFTIIAVRLSRHKKLGLLVVMLGNTAKFLFYILYFSTY